MAVPDAELLWGWAGFPLMLDLDPVCIFNRQKKTVQTDFKQGHHSQQGQTFITIHTI